jgi:nitrogen fixation protein NifZ
MAHTEDPGELDRPPAFDVGFKVRANADVRNDGTYPGAPVGAFLIRAGDVGYVRSVGEYLQLYRIYAVDFLERGMIVGMRAKELDLVDARCNDPQG